MRNKYNLSHNVHLAGHIGRIQTITVIPVIAGDSIDLSLNGIFRTATTRKEIVSECQIDICAFFVKHRHVYGDAWSDLVKEGLQHESVLPIGPGIPATARNPFFLGIHTCGANINRALIYGYNEIYRRYFMVPSTQGNGQYDVNQGPLQYPDGTDDEDIHCRLYGYRAARLPHILNGATLVNQNNADSNVRDYSSADWGVPILNDFPIAGSSMLDIRDLAQIKGRYKSVQEQNYFATFYSDVMQRKWSQSGVNTDADQRPDYLGRSTQFVSGSDVNGTDDATLGSFVGKTLDRLGFKIQRRIFKEHGNLWVMMVPRFPLVHTREQHPLLATASPDNKLILADPTVVAAEPVVAWDPSLWMGGGSSFLPDINYAQHAYGQEYRYQPNRIHPVFEQIPGYPFTQWDSAGIYHWYYYRDGEYDDTFQVSQTEHWTAHMQVNASRFSTLPAPTTSIMAGAN